MQVCVCVRLANIDFMLNLAFINVCDVKKWMSVCVNSGLQMFLEIC